MIHEEVVDLVTGGAEVFDLQFGADVVGNNEVHLVLEGVADFLPGILVPGIDHGQLVAGTETGTGIGRADQLRHLHHVFHGAAILSARHQNHVRA